MKPRKKIKLFQQHFAYIDEEFLFNFEQQTGTINLSSFIKQCAYEDFQIYLTNKESLADFEYILHKSDYKNKTEWLRAKMREAMMKNK